MARSSVSPNNQLPVIIRQLKTQTRLRRRLRKAYDKLGNQMFVLEHPDYFLKKKGHYHNDTQVPAALTPEQKAECEKQRIENLPILEVLAEAQAPLARRLVGFDHEVEHLAKSLPVYPWVKATPGIGALGLGLIVGEAGDLSNYANPAKLWKRFGLAVMPDGRAQGRVSGRAMTSTWLSPITPMSPRTDPIEQGFSPTRRAILHTIGAAMVKLKGCAYREMYLKRKEYEHRTEGMTKLHAHRRAMRYMEKRFLRDLWTAWQTTLLVEPTTGVSPDE